MTLLSIAVDVDVYSNLRLSAIVNKCGTIILSVDEINEFNSWYYSTKC